MTFLIFHDKNNAKSFILISITEKLPFNRGEEYGREKGNKKMH